MFDLGPLCLNMIQRTHPYLNRLFLSLMRHTLLLSLSLSLSHQIKKTNVVAVVIAIGDDDDDQNETKTILSECIQQTKRKDSNYKPTTHPMFFFSKNDNKTHSSLKRATLSLSHTSNVFHLAANKTMQNVR